MSNVQRVSRLECVEIGDWNSGKSEYGRYNSVFFTNEVSACDDKDTQIYHGYLVYKDPQAFVSATTAPLDVPVVAVDVFRDINPSLFCACYKEGWVSTFINGVEASDEETASEMLGIYRRCRRIVLDGYAKNNFLKLVDGTVTCVDVGMAVKRGCEASNAFWEVPDIKGFMADLNKKFEAFSKPERLGVKPKTIAVTQTLQYLESHLAADLIRDEHIRENVMQALHTAREEKTPVTVNTLNCLLLLDQTNQLRKIDDMSGFLSFVEEQGAAPIRAEGLVIGYYFQGVAETLTIEQSARQAALIEYLSAIKKEEGRQDFGISPALKKSLDIDRSSGSKVARIAAMVLTNAALILLCLVGVGAAIFCWQQKRTGHKCWFFDETKTIKNLRIAQCRLQRP